MQDAFQANKKAGTSEMLTEAPITTHDQLAN